MSRSLTVLTVDDPSPAVPGRAESRLSTPTLPLPAGSTGTGSGAR